MTRQGAYKNPIAKYIHEYMFWKKELAEKGFLPNAHYEALFTTLFGLEKAFYDGKRLLDIGCGPCGSLEWADNAAQRVGLDPLAEAYGFLERAPQEMEYTPDFVEHIAFPDASFDVVTSINSLDHVDDLAQATAEMARVVRPGGHILIACEISPAPKPCEPTLVGWDLAAHFSGKWRVLDASRFPFSENVSTSILHKQPLDPSAPIPPHGVLRLILQKGEEEKTLK
ncbi:class I SAM-dependent methyltransferase [Desulfovibrio sp. JY]|nr:class I SAM-dependent methyltransferase [Desulfovibrio sp. JY]